MYNVLDTVVDHIHHGRKIEAIKLVRNQTNMGLKESKDYVEGMMVLDVTSRYSVEATYMDMDKPFTVHDHMNSECVAWCADINVARKIARALEEAN